MSRWIKNTLIALAILLLALIIGFMIMSQYRTSTIASKTSTLGVAINSKELIANISTGKKIETKVINAADWQVPLAGLLDLSHPVAKKAKLTNKEEAINIFAFHIKHPKFGDYFIDTGVSESFAKTPGEFGVPGWVEPMLGLEKLSVNLSTKDYLNQNNISTLNGIFLTHLHLDHISGLPDINNSAPLYVGKQEASAKYWMNIATQGAVDKLAEGFGDFNEWQAPIVDVFNDGSLFAIHMPGHTKGSTAYLINAVNGPILAVGDVSHTRWGWDNKVGPGQFSMDKNQNQLSLMKLQSLVRNIPNLTVILGHQH